MLVTDDYGTVALKKVPAAPRPPPPAPSPQVTFKLKRSAFAQISGARTPNLGTVRT